LQRAIPALGVIPDFAAGTNAAQTRSGDDGWDYHTAWAGLFSRERDFCQTAWRTQVLASRWSTIVAAAASLVASFFITLWLTEPDTINSANAGAKLDPVERLRRSQVYNNASLASAARAANLVPLEDVRGNIDEIRRLPEGQVRIVGWAVNLSGDGSPLTLVAFTGGRGTLLGKTDGPREDVTKALGLSATAAKHVKIETLVQCERGEVVGVVAIDKDGAYAPIKFDRCP
jgi:hypothetical protein